MHDSTKQTERLDMFQRFTAKIRTLHPALTNQTAAIDLASIMVGVVVIGVIAGTIAATVFAVIPWSQNAAARGALDSVRTAQSVARVQDGKFEDIPTLISKGYLPSGTSTTAAADLVPAGGSGMGLHAAVTATPTPGQIVATLDPSGTCYVVAIQSQTGAVFYEESGSPTVVQLAANTAAPSTSCSQSSVASGGPAVAFPAIGGITAAVVVAAPVLDANGCAPVQGVLATAIKQTDPAAYAAAITSCYHLTVSTGVPMPGAPLCIAGTLNSAPGVVYSVDTATVVVVQGPCSVVGVSTPM